MSPRFVRRLAAVAALALGAGAAAVAPAASASIRPECGWESLTLLNGWQSAQANWNTGDPEYCLDNGIVYLAGSLRNPANADTEFAVLPSQELPTSNLDLLVYTYGGSTGQLTIGSNGAMYAAGSGADQYTSLAGISFPVAGTSLTPLSLYPGWQSGQSQFGTGNPAYVVSGGIVHWTGSLTNANDTNHFAMVPSNTYADRCLDANVYTNGGHVGTLQIWPPSTMFPADYDMTVFNAIPALTYYAQLTSLAGISYPVNGAAAWQPLALQNGWAAASPNDYCQYYPSTPSYYVQGHIVYLTGEIVQDPVGGGFLGTLPAGARPQHDLYLMVGRSNEYLHISPNGNMYAFGADQPNLVSLGNISYQTSS